MWYDRPFLLEDESQHERFLASTGVLNYFSAQALLHKIPLNALLTRRYATHCVRDETCRVSKLMRLVSTTVLTTLSLSFRV